MKSQRKTFQWSSVLGTASAITTKWIHDKRFVPAFHTINKQLIQLKGYTFVKRDENNLNTKWMTTVVVTIETMGDEARLSSGIADGLAAVQSVILLYQISERYINNVCIRLPFGSWITSWWRRK